MKLKSKFAKEDAAGVTAKLKFLNYLQVISRSFIQAAYVQIARIPMQDQLT